MLPQVLSVEKKRNKVKNLLTEMRVKDKSIRSTGKGRNALWDLAQSGSDKLPKNKDS
jgi:hypothetical protein